MGLGPEAIDDTLATLARNRARSRSPQDSQRRIAEVSAQAARHAEEFSTSLLTLLTVEGEALRARQQAEHLWGRLKLRPADQQLALVEESKLFRTWALCERMAAESITAAARKPAEALELAKLARRTAELCPVEKTFQCRLEGYAGFHVCNVLRVLNDLPAADAELSKARKLWDAGAPGDPGLLNPAVVLGIEATLRKAQRRFPEALQRIEEALIADGGELLKGRLLLAKSQILQALGGVAESTATLEKAVPFVTEPRSALGVRYQMLTNLCRLGRAGEAEPGLRAVQALAEQAGNGPDLLRVVWLRGAVHAGQGRLEEAHSAFDQVRRAFKEEKLPLDFALVSLELALVLLEQGQTREVRGIAEEMLWIFQAQGVHREALAALRIFCEAAQREAATIELTRRLIAFLDRAQHDPELCFEKGGEAAP